jgi:Outer membrane protein beta-barrel domain
MQQRTFKPWRALIALTVFLASVAVAAQEADEHPLRGPYIFGSVSHSRYTLGTGFVTCRCNGGTATAFKLGAGYRFGVTGVEVWATDFGEAKFDADPYAPAGSARFRAIAVGPVLTARVGSSFDFLWRLGAAKVSVSGNGQQPDNSVRPAFGTGLGWRVTETMTLDFVIDYVNVKGRNGELSDVASFGLGLRQRF